MPVGPHIKSLIDNFGDFAFRISFSDFPDGSGRSIQDPRNWEKEFKKMSENGDDSLLIEDVFEGENPEEWS
ncbi:MAG: hypothetical protein WD431_04030 [Cyclobacteriaceae bacterium]